jgi:hypothetical protein
MRPGTAPAAPLPGLGAAEPARCETAEPGARRGKKKSKDKAAKGKGKARGKRAPVADADEAARQRHKAALGALVLGLRPRSPVSVKPLPTAAECLAAKLALSDELGRRVVQLEATLSRLDREVAATKELALEERRERRLAGGIKATRIQQALADKQMRILENRLNKTTMRGCEVDAENQRLVSQINGLRVESQQLSKTFTRASAAYRLRQKELAHLLQHSDQQCHARAEAVAEAARARERAAADEAAVEAEMARLASLLADQAKLAGFVSVEQTAKRRAADVEQRLQAGELSKEEAAAFRNKLGRLDTLSHHASGSTGASAGSPGARSRADSAKSLSDAFEAIYRAGGLSSPQEVVQALLAGEEQNFSIFNFIQHANREADADERALQALREDFSKFRREMGQQDASRERIVKELTERRDQLRAAGADAARQAKHRMQTLEAVAQATESIFFAIGCNNAVGLPRRGAPGPVLAGAGTTGSHRRAPPGPESSGSGESRVPHEPTWSPRPETDEEEEPAERSGKPGAASLLARLGDQVTERNIMLYLGLVEQKTNELVQQLRANLQRANVAFRGSERIGSSGLPVPAVPRGSHGLVVHVPACHVVAVPGSHDRDRDRAQAGPAGADARRPSWARGAAQAELARDDADDGELERPLFSQQIRAITARELGLPRELASMVGVPPIAIAAATAAAAARGTGR